MKVQLSYRLITISLFLSLLSTFTAIPTFASNRVLDENFNLGNGITGTSNVVKVQPDGKVLIGTDLSIFRVMPNGEIDNSFNVGGAGSNGAILSIELDSTGKILIGGRFTSYNSESRNYIARLNSDGTLDRDFEIDIAFNSAAFSPITNINIAEDGKILFLARNSVPLRIESDGSIDRTFQSDIQGNTITTLDVLPDGKILIGGSGLHFWYSELGSDADINCCLLRLDSSGKLDKSFIQTRLDNGYINNVAIRVNGNAETYKIIVSGPFDSYNDFPAPGIVQLESTGEVDEDFVIPTQEQQNYSSIYPKYISIQDDGRILASFKKSQFPTVKSSQGSFNIKRFNADGTLDDDFDNGETMLFNGDIHSIDFNLDGNIYVGGNFTLVNDVLKGGLIAIDQNGLIIPSFVSPTIPGPDRGVLSIARQTDGKILIGGSFNSFDGIARNGIARLNTDGSLDLGFAPELGPHLEVSVIAIQEVVKIVLVGIRYAENSRGALLIRLNPNGSIDDGFEMTHGFSSNFYSVAIQSDGKILTFGWQRYSRFVNGVYTESDHHVFRFNSDGSIDSGFQLSTKPGYSLEGEILISNNKILVVFNGSMNFEDNVVRNGIYRLNSNGTLDQTFDPGIGFEVDPDIFGGARTIAVDSVGRIVVGGFFRYFNGVEQPGLIRINSDGSFDSSFSPDAITVDGFPIVDSVLLKSDGSMLVGHSEGIARLNSNGVIDNGFIKPIRNRGPNNAVVEIIEESATKVIIGGFFTRFGSLPINRIARLNIDPLSTITFYANDGSELMQTQSSSSQTELASNSFIREGFKFTGWNTEANGSGSSYGDEALYDFTFDLTLYAQWSPLSNTVFFDANGGSGSMTPQISDESTWLKRNTFTRDDYRFTGWNTAADGSGTGYSNRAKYGFNAEITLYAQWEEVQQGPVQPEPPTTPDAQGNEIVSQDFNNISGSRINGVIHAIEIQSDDRILIGTDFGVYRLRPDGSIDDSFKSEAAGIRGQVFSLALQENGKILVGGNLIFHKGSSPTNIIRLNPDGSLDEIFNSEVYGRVTSIHIQTDGKILISVGGSLIRLNINGTIDETFKSLVKNGTDISAVALQADGKILFGGVEFDFWSEIDIDCCLVRLNIDGSVDEDFNTDVNGVVTNIFVQSNSKIVVSGFFNQYGELPVSPIIRLNSDGSLDESIQFPPGIGYRTTSILPLPAGGFAVGYSGSISSPPVLMLRIFNENGDENTSFLSSPTTGPNGEVNALKAQSDGKILVGGNFTRYNQDLAHGLVRVNADGSPDESFNFRTNFSADRDINVIKVQPNGKVLIGGNFDSYNGVARNGIARLNSDGSLETLFDVQLPQGAVINAIEIQGDGTIILGGCIDIDANPRILLVKVSAFDGSLDPDFSQSEGIGGGVIHSVSIDANGRILIGGLFWNYKGVERLLIARLNSDGFVDLSFNANIQDTYIGAGREINAILVQSDGKILIGDNAETVFENGESRYGISRLNEDGSLDSSFDSGSGLLIVPGFAGRVSVFAEDSTGRILVGGSFTSYNGVQRLGILRINSDGTLDTEFEVEDEISPNSIWVQPDGKIIVGTSRSILRFQDDGTRDSTFDYGNEYGPNGAVKTIVKNTESTFFIGGSFTLFGSTPVNRIAKLNIESSYSAYFYPNSGKGFITRQKSDSPTSLKPNVFTREGFLFSSWNTDPDGLGTSYEDGAIYDFDSIATFFAQWLQVFTVTFNSNGGSGSISPQTSDEAASLTSNTFTRNGYRFTGWNTAANGSGSRYSNRATYDFTADLTLYAQWEEAQQGPVDPEPPINTDSPIQEVVPQPLPKLDPIKPGDNPNLPATGLSPGSSTVLINGIPQQVTTRTNSTTEPTQIEIEINGSITRLAGTDKSGRPLKLTTVDGKPVLLLEPEGKLNLDSAGFLPDTEVTIWLFSEPKLLGTFKTNSNGVLSGSIFIPEMALGNHMLQINGITPQRTLKSLSIGLQVKEPEPVKPIILSIKKVIQFNKNSAKLTASAIRSLSEVFSSKNGALEKITVKGFTQKGELKNNQRALSMARAKAVSDHIKSIGISTLAKVKNGGVFKKSGDTGRRVVLTVVTTSNP